MSFLTLLPLFLVTVGDTEEVGREQLTRFLDASRAELHDLEFVFEGRIAPANPTPKPDPSHPGKMTNPDDFINNYQGTFAWRSDDSAHLENYVQNVDPKRALSRQIMTLFRGSVARLNRVPDHASSDVPVAGKPGGILSLQRPMSPVRFLQFLVIKEHLRSPTWHYSFQRWEGDANARLLVVDLSTKPPPYGDGTLAYRCWIDMGRSCMPVKIEGYLGTNLRSRVSEINLYRIDANNKQLWIPTGCKCESFFDLSGFSKKPISVETYSIVNGTIRVNQGLPDGRFQLDYSAKPTTEGLVRAKMSFDGVATASRTKQERPQERIDRALAEADRQSEQLRASSPSRESWVFRNPIATAIVALSGASLIILGVRRWTAR